MLKARDLSLNMRSTQITVVKRYSSFKPCCTVIGTVFFLLKRRCDWYYWYYHPMVTQLISHFYICFNWVKHLNYNHLIWQAKACLSITFFSKWSSLHSHKWLAKYRLVKDAFLYSLTIREGLNNCTPKGCTPMAAMLKHPLYEFYIYLKVY